MGSVGPAAVLAASISSPQMRFVSSKKSNPLVRGAHNPAGVSDIPRAEFRPVENNARSNPTGRGRVRVDYKLMGIQPGGKSTRTDRAEYSGPPLEHLNVRAG